MNPEATAANIAKLEHDYAAYKQKYETWKRENARAAGNPSYDQYVQRFLAWERGALQQLRDLKEAAARHQQQSAPVAEVVPIGGPAHFETLDQRLEAALRDISPTDFMMAVFAVGQKDPGILMKLFEVVERESRGTGFTNPILPQRTGSTGGGNVGGGAGSGSLPFRPTSHHLHPAGPTRYGGHQLAPQRVGVGAPPSLVYSQMTPYGFVPEGWVVEPPVLKPPPRSSSPPRPYKNPSSLPFRDFSQ